MEEITEPDPLLKAGAFIDPNPFPTNGNPSSNGQSNPKSTTDESQPLDTRPDWLPSDWTYIQRVRTSGASAGTRDKYYVEPVTQQRFRSKTEVLRYLETGIRPKKRKDSETSDSLPASNSMTPKRKKSETKEKYYMKNFNFDDVPLKVKWELLDIYEGTWRPLSNGVDRVPESTKQEWNAAYTYLTLQNPNRG